ncbi:Holliday junction resolvase RuvX [candidate division WOR-3 bacterium]|nr:Holliday junction resolvase RuvX [candidate division WOR-3 bacterium]
MAVDYGTKRIGIAITDPLGVISQPLETIAFTSEREMVRRLKCLVHENDVGVVLVGNPISMSGGSTAMAENVQRFVKKLQKALPIEVRLWDERLTSKYARTRMKEVGIRKTSKKCDQVAACIMLDEYLMSQAHYSA